MKALPARWKRCQAVEAWPSPRTSSHRFGGVTSAAEVEPVLGGIMGVLPALWIAVKVWLAQHCRREAVASTTLSP
jgi:hypothetical protein